MAYMWFNMVVFELSVLVICLTFLLVLRKLDKDILRKFFITCIAVFLFEAITNAMWLNLNLEKWAYFYGDLSWVITIGWSTIIIVSISIIDLYFAKKSELGRFIFYLVPVSIIGLIAESVVLNLGIRSYPSSVKDSLSGHTILGIVPIEALYYIPVFMTLVIAFSRYWEISFRENTAINLRGSKR